MNHTPVTPADIEAAILSTHYFTAEEGAQGALAKERPELGMENPTLALLTFCVLVTKNGHTITGEAHCQDPAKFDAETGRTEARKDAINKLWPMAVYAARQQAPEAVPVPKPKPYAWADVMAAEVLLDSKTYRLRMRDGRVYVAAPTGGYHPDEIKASLLAECNRQRDLAA